MQTRDFTFHRGQTIFDSGHTIAELLAIAQRFPQVFCSVGTHPHNAHEELDLTVDDLIAHRYVLEVSSPGIERGLYKRADYERFAGSRVKLRTSEPIDGQRNFRGTIAGVAQNQVVLDDRTSGRVEIPFEFIAKANLEVDVESDLRQPRERKSTDRDLIRKNR